MLADIRKLEDTTIIHACAAYGLWRDSRPSKVKQSMPAIPPIRCINPKVTGTKTKIQPGPTHVLFGLQGIPYKRDGPKVDANHPKGGPQLRTDQFRFICKMDTAPTTWCSDAIRRAHGPAA
ncbi:hypothetical protein FA15DRAFT_163588 [Coprinopsis marcescibilis]|uniref:Uncharacterized protein n=1 Tax=Coprinopsis marcescibilis TaxID=230819 RepID=A0A5C3KI39_COPMA|nr:hypothetical protein FA15DRAFT_163588 [Coprinopsis marcescibilis]